MKQDSVMYCYLDDAKTFFIYKRINIAKLQSVFVAITRIRNQSTPYITGIELGPSINIGKSQRNTSCNLLAVFRNVKLITHLEPLSINTFILCAHLYHKYVCKKTIINRFHENQTICFQKSLHDCVTL